MRYYILSKFYPLHWASTSTFSGFSIFFRSRQVVVLLLFLCEKKNKVIAYRLSACAHARRHPLAPLYHSHNISGITKYNVLGFDFFFAFILFWFNGKWIAKKFAQQCLNIVVVVVSLINETPNRLNINGAPSNIRYLWTGSKHISHVNDQRFELKRVSWKHTTSNEMVNWTPKIY